LFTDAQQATNVVVAVQMPNGERHQNRFNPSTKLWSVLTQWLEQEKKLEITNVEGQQVVLSFMQTEVRAFLFVLLHFSFIILLFYYFIIFVR
jgi:hypothetical protein